MGDYSGISPSVAILLKRQKGKCAHCGQYFREEDIMEKDHIVPKSQGGNSTYKNLQLLHAHCHDSKTANDNKTLADSKHPAGCPAVIKAKQQRDSIEQRWLDGETDFTDDEKVIFNEILEKRYEDLESYADIRFINHTEKRKRKKPAKGNKPKTRKPVQYIKGRKVKKQEAPKGCKIA